MVGLLRLQQSLLKTGLGVSEAQELILRPASVPTNLLQVGQNLQLALPDPWHAKLREAARCCWSPDLRLLGCEALRAAGALADAACAQVHTGF
jgi:hypothetical protein